MRLLPVAALLLLAVLCGQSSAAAETLLVYETAGTHYEVGYNVGKHFSDRINGYIAKYSNLNQVLIPYAQTPQGAAALKSLIAINSAKFPDVWSELEGIVAGSRANKTAIMLLAFEDELSALAPNATAATRRRRSGPFERCTDILLINSTRGVAMVGHNEDADPLVTQFAYIVNATYYSSAGAEVSRIYSFCYPGTTAGEAWGYTASGLWFSQNAVFPVNVAVGVANMFLSRTVYDCASLSCVFAVYDSFKPLVACGYSMNVGSYSVSSAIAIYNVEIGRNSTSILQITSNYTHVNLYQHSPGVPQLPDPSSDHRLAVSYSLPPVYNDITIVALLGNTQDPVYPIYRTGAAPDCCATVTSTYVDLVGRVMSYWFAENPADGPPVDTIRLR